MQLLSSPGRSFRPNGTNPVQLKMYDFFPATDSLVAGEPVVSACTAVVRGRRRQATEPCRCGVPLVEADAAAQGVAARGALGAVLGRHLQELARLAGECWREDRRPRKS